MKKKFLLPFVALIAVLFVSIACAAEIAVGGANGLTVTFKDIVMQDSTTNYIGYVGEVVPIRVVFTSNVSASNVRIKAWIEGHREEIASSTRRLTLLENAVYTELLNLKLPSTLELTDEPYTLHIGIYGATDYTEATYTIRMQRESYELRSLSIDFNQEVEAGSTLPIMIVVKNLGFHDAEDIYVTASIPEVGAYAKAYLGDLVAVENCSDNCDRDDATSKILNLKIPENAKEGLYNVVVTLYNADTRTVERKLLKINEAKKTSTILATTRSQDIKAGETKEYEVVIVNADNTIKVFNVAATSSSALEVSVNPSVVTVGPQEAKTVKIAVKAKDNAEEGSYTVNVLVNDQQTTLVANVVKGSVAEKGVLALTIVLAIIFVALVVLLIFLLFKRDKKEVEEIETSYY